ncbi:hypothetical protein [Legionella longbeachae]|uniref:Uncharacterized protein n=1 Tax=Legionella longbeachae serogroup 1 (strain NSW150) TaxID=661367 RepID=D3HJ13_LEGLN|nr:hypothetical protein [Legionella longbeachae]VEE02902.1 Uncharacterised protein [Legionella oakridgensis]HBD7398895.1 hypothetical protein [Legionella pneumophila]ARB90857.1 hypothetical protein A6J40_01010 [Legionella longbeachae]ARM32717.1 hypothetical protein B0B39_03935 [Legionella longbeachae]EEZ94499.1 conserved hypothetical protein [Legionella longbeachae D-4968]
MITEEEVLIEKTKTISLATSKKKKTVSWNDNESEGKIREEYLNVSESASPSKKILNAQMKQLVEQEGYSELEAAAFVGKPQTLSGDVILNEPTFYASQEEIKDQVAEKKEFKSAIGGQETRTMNSFFRTNMIHIGIPAIDAQEKNIKNMNENKEKSTIQGNENIFFGVRRPLIIGMTTSMDTSAIMALANYKY